VSKRVSTANSYGGKTNLRGCEGCGAALLYLDYPDDQPIYCPPCRIARLLPPLTMPKYVPWYDLMTPEELEAIRQKKWTGGRTVWLDDGVYAPRDGCAVRVLYEKTDGTGTVALMAGKVIPRPGMGHIFYHAWDGIEQGHHQTNCPCPVDTVVADFLAAQRIAWFYGYDKNAHRLWKIGVETIAEAPAMEYSKQTVRQRFFPDRVYWESLTDIHEQRQGVNVRLVVGREGRKSVLAVPFVKAEITLRHVPK
jgi:hypothetical protein